MLVYYNLECCDTARNVTAVKATATDASNTWTTTKKMNRVAPEWYLEGM
jgi:hypothetical protein